MIDPQELAGKFRQQFSSDAQWFARAPGRVNLIGEHTDYNGGLMLPAAIDRETAAVARLTNGDIVRVWSVNFEQEVTFDPQRPADPTTLRGWPRYFTAVLEQFRERNITVPPMDIAMVGNVPLGSGLSSSASLEVCIATLINAITGAGLTPMKIAHLGQAAEHSPFVGVMCGIMDQAASALCRRDHALLIDATAIAQDSPDAVRSIAFPASQAAILIIDTRKRRGLVDSEYNRRREQCARALAHLNKRCNAEWATLSDIPLDVAQEHLESIPSPDMPRARHVISENLRTRSMADAMIVGDCDAFRSLMFASHESLRDDYEVSCRELDFAVSLAMEQKGCLGARMTGAGFGGCAVALFRTQHVDNALAAITRDYSRQLNIQPECLVTAPAEGATARSL